MNCWNEITLKTMKWAMFTIKRKLKVRAGGEDLLRIAPKVKRIRAFCFSQLIACQTAPIVAPAGRAEDILPFFLPADVVAGDVLADGLPLVKYNIHRAGILQRLGETIFDGLVFGLRQLGLKGAEKLIPDNEEHAHIPVEILAIRSVMYAVMRRGHQDVFQPAHFLNELGVDKDAPDLRSGIHKDDIHRAETQERQRNKIDKTIERLEDRRPEANRKIEMFG